MCKTYHPPQFLLRGKGAVSVSPLAAFPERPSVPRHPEGGKPPFIQAEVYCSVATESLTWRRRANSPTRMVSLSGIKGGIPEHQTHGSSLLRPPLLQQYCLQTLSLPRNLHVSPCLGHLIQTSCFLTLARGSLHVRHT